MTTTKCLTIAAAVLAASVTFAKAQTIPDHAAHHPATELPLPAQPPAAPASPADVSNHHGGMNPQGAMGMRGTAASVTMMRMMSAARPMGMGAVSADPFRHIDGQLAFAKAELHLTSTQLPEWNAFAAALRQHVAALEKTATQTGQVTPATPVPEQLQRSVTVLSARLDTMRGVLRAAEPLYATLNNEQRQTADAFVADHIIAMRARGL